MLWHWKVRIYDSNGHYWHGQVATGRDLKEIDGIQEAYYLLTGCKILLEGMSEQEDPNVGTLQEAFAGLWSANSGAAQSPATNQCQSFGVVNTLCADH